VTNLSESSFGRRAFIGVAAGTVAAVAVPEVVHAAVSAPAARPGRAGPARIGARAAGPSAADWTALGHQLAGTLVRPNEAAYNIDRLLFDPRFDGQRPAGIAYVKNPHDVATCIAFVRKFKIPFSTRSGGHSDGGYSGNTGGLIVDVQNFRSVTVSGSTAVVGTGTRLVDFYNALAAKGRAVPGGSCPTVGIAGLTLGGGIGVATSFTFRTVAAPSPCIFSLTWPWSQAVQVVAGW
jgi:FAD binding domain